MKDAILIHLDYCLTPNTRINNAAIVIRDGRINSVGGYSAFVHTENYDVLEMPGCYALPGFIDTHISGAAQFDIMHANTSPNIDKMSQALAEHGVTSFLPTTHSSAHDHLLAVVEALREQAGNEDLPGAVPMGIHIDGPFISMAKRGAHQERYVSPVDLGLAREIIETGADKVMIFTFAPELDQSLELIELLCEHGISPCMGHTIASQDQVTQAVDAGANRCLHVYNGMEPLQQRKVGLAAISMIDKRIWVELIPDGIHSHWGMLELACRCKTVEKMVGISNSTEAAGLTDGKYHLGDRVIMVRDSHVTLEDGTIAGAANFLDQNYRNMMRHTEMTQEQAAACFTMNPASSVGVRDRGRIKPGKRADLVILDGDHKVQMTVVQGRIVYSKTDPNDLLQSPDRPLPESFSSLRA